MCTVGGTDIRTVAAALAVSKGAATAIVQNGSRNLTFAVGTNRGLGLRRTAQQCYWLTKYGAALVGRLVLGVWTPRSGDENHEEELLMCMALRPAAQLTDLSLLGPFANPAAILRQLEPRC